MVIMKNILLIEDDMQITNLLSLHLHEPFYQLTACDKGAVALEKMAGSTIDLVILDIMLPDLSGIEVCRRIREHNARTPILMLSSLSEETDKVTALELGADDYMTKPFGIFELMARIKALLRREVGAGAAGPVEGMVAPAGAGAMPVGQGVLAAAGATGGHAVSTAPAGQTGTGSIYCKDMVIDRDKHKVTIRGQRLELTPKEFDLLWLLASCPGKTFTRHELLELIWGFAFQEYEHTVTSHINRLRIKLEKNLNKPEYILTTWGTGYRFAE
jgi:two-component system, OmpR family, alkaline phosphatase synthesis response regulator PhoP